MSDQNEGSTPSDDPSGLPEGSATGSGRARVIVGVVAAVIGLGAGLAIGATALGGSDTETVTVSETETVTETETVAATEPEPATPADGGGSEEEPADASSSGDEFAPGVPTVARGENLRMSDYTVKVHEVTRASQLPGDDITDPVPAEGEFRIVQLTVTNRAGSVVTFNTGLMRLVAEDGTFYTPDAGGGEDQIGALPDYLSQAELQPKQPKRGAIAVDVPKGEKIAFACFGTTVDYLGAEPVEDVQGGCVKL